ncbi:hypothetical protein QBC47DRAFT_398969 [Echria macrotheca]|uniref:Uncharacterized protein n=1 Tax=Echria macrotheca TaxID=438768 RepID=A0AAJ0BGX9_9PEZI|nr:hypothetical protein QBC47DRAFT_398969 [Echria macrotheca]
MRWNPGVSHILPAREEEELKKSDEYVSLEEKIKKISLDIGSTTSEETLTAQSVANGTVLSTPTSGETALDECQGN